MLADATLTGVLVGAGASIAGVAITGLISVLTQRQRLRHEVTLARENRLFDVRRAAYGSVIRNVHSVSYLMHDVFSGQDVTGFASETDRVLSSMYAELHPVASAEVIAAFEDWASAIQAFLGAVRAALQPEGVTKVTDHVQQQRLEQLAKLALGNVRVFSLRINNELTQGGVGNSS